MKRLASPRSWLPWLPSPVLSGALRSPITSPGIGAATHLSFLPALCLIRLGRVSHILGVRHEAVTITD